MTINRIYKIVLTLSITIQLSMFFMAVTVSLWIDQLFNSAIGDMVDFETLYKVSSFVTLVVGSVVNSLVVANLILLSYWFHG